MINFLIFIAVIILAGALGFSIYWTLKQQSQRNREASELRKHDEFEAMVEGYIEKTRDDCPFTVSARINGIIKNHDVHWITFTDNRGPRVYGRIREMMDLEEVNAEEERKLQALTIALTDMKDRINQRPYVAKGATQHVSVEDGVIIRHTTGLKRVLKARDHMVIRIAEKPDGAMIITEVRLSANLTNYLPDIHDVSSNELRQAFDRRVINNPAYRNFAPELAELARIDEELKKYNQNRHKFLYATDPDTKRQIIIGYDPYAVGTEQGPLLDYSDLDEA
jgi:hypothetical protein